VPVAPIAAQLRERGALTLYPRRGAAGLELCVVAAASELGRGSGRFAEPAEGALRAAVEAVDVFVVPGLLFDRSCRRLGRGGGDYDRLLARARRDAARVGICYADRVVDELPEDPWDVAMDVVVTERFVLRRGRPG
jgi:5-formyltetrahydrofolate cyclo-ligase